MRLPHLLATMLEGGDDPRYIARRLVRMASEDIGLADPTALGMAVAAAQTVQLIGAPECDTALAQVAVYLARAPKSVEAYKALSAARAAIREHKGPLPGVPLHLRNPTTKLMRSLGFGQGYKYNPDFDDPVDQSYMPDGLQHLNFFEQRYSTK